MENLLKCPDPKDLSDTSIILSIRVILDGIDWCRQQLRGDVATQAIHKKLREVAQLNAELVDRGCTPIPVNTYSKAEQNIILLPEDHSTERMAD